MTREQVRTAIISGGGIGGLCAALALRQIGWRVAVYEAAPILSEIGAGLTLWPNALHALDRLGLGAATRALGVVDLDGGTIANREGRVLATISTAALAARHGAPIIVVHRAEFQALLADALGREHLHTGAQLRAYDPDDGGKVVAHFADGQTARGDIMIGADGLRSATRRQLRGPRAVGPRYAGYTAWRALIPYPHDRIPRWGEIWGRGQRAGIAPVSGERVYFFATRNAPPGSGRDSSPDERKAILVRHFGEWAAPLPALLAAIDPAALLQHDIEELPPLPRWGAGPATLLGDAAHAMTPNLGQGACLAIEDAVVLAACLRGATDLSGALRRYEGQRRPRTTAIARQAQFLGRVGQWSHPLACGVRDRAVGLLPPPLRLRAFDRVIRWRPPG
jgi:2-polyprenyl-6-methoxyphenol hydroxylase-like FAD-dependent oxidoreductase